MAKRFTDTDIWEQDWFIALPSKYKHLWSFIKDKCDDCGAWRPNKGLLELTLGEKIDLNEFLSLINTEEKTRILVLENGRWFLKDFFFFQYGDNFNPHSPVHRGVLKRLVNNGITLQELSKVTVGKLLDADIQILREIAYQYPKDTLIVSYQYPINRVKDKDKDKDKDIKEVNKGGVGEKEEEKKKKKSFKEFSKEDFGKELEQFKDSYTREFLKEFFDYWKELSANGKMRFQLEKTWETNLRLQKWERNNQKKVINGTHNTTSRPLPRSEGAIKLLDQLAADMGINRR